MHASDKTTAHSRQQASFFITMMGVTLLCMLVSGLLNFIFFPEDTAMLATTLAITAMVILMPVIYVRYGYRLLLSFIWFAALSGFLFVVDFPVTGGVASPDIGWYYQAVGVMCMMASVELGIVLGVLGSGVLAWLYFQGGYAVGPLPTQEYFTITYIMQGVFILGMLLVFNRLRVEILREMRRRQINFKEISGQLLSSIDYAKRIRTALLPKADVAGSPLSELYLLDEPKQAISGDFFYSREVDGRHYLCLADCSGHGVPGSFISALGICFLDEALLSLGLRDPAEILAFIRRQLTDRLRPATDEEPIDDGMVAAILCLDTAADRLTVASSQIPVHIRIDNRWETRMGNRYPLAWHPTNHLPFDQVELRLSQVEEIFMATDGLTDQLSETGKRFTTRRLDDYLADTRDLPLPARQTLLRDRLRTWQGTTPQTDDVLAVWMRVAHTENQLYDLDSRRQGQLSLK